MKTDKRRTAKFIGALVIACAFLAAEALLLGRWSGIIAIPEDPEPGVTEADVDRLFREHFEAFDRAADALWQPYGIFGDWQSSDFNRIVYDGGMFRFKRRYDETPAEEIDYGAYMTDGEWQAVLALPALLEPYRIRYYGPIHDRGRLACRARAIVVSYRVPDGDRPWEEGWKEICYIYARCAGEDHEGYDLTCDALRAMLLKVTMNVDDWEPLEQPCWHRATVRKRR